MEYVLKTTLCPKVGGHTSCDEIGLPTRDQYIENYKQCIRCLLYTSCARLPKATPHNSRLAA